MDKRFGRLTLVVAFLLFIVLFSVSSVFAEESSPLAFSLVHNIDMKTEYKFVFKDSEGEVVSSIELADGEDHEDFTSLYLQHNANLIIKGLTVVGSDLETSDKSAAYPYTMTLLDRDGDVIEWIRDAEGSGRGVAHIIPKTTVFRYKDTKGEIKLADFSIDLTVQDEVPTGTYDGTMTLYYVVI